MNQFKYLFAVRPSVNCNYNCNYCYRHDDIHNAYTQSTFNIDSMLWHASNYENNLFNFCGYGETMMHPQFGDMIVKLSEVTSVNWITNGTMFNSKHFINILNNANHKNIMEVVVSIHADQIKDIINYNKLVRWSQGQLAMRGIRCHMTAILSNDNIDNIIEIKKYFPDMIIKHPFDVYINNGIIISYKYSDKSNEKMQLHNIQPIKDWMDNIQIPYIGNVCPNGVNIFEILHNGVIYDCSYDENRRVIGNINDKILINSLSNERICKSNCNACVPMLRNSYNLVC